MTDKKEKPDSPNLQITFVKIIAVISAVYYLQTILFDIKILIGYSAGNYYARLVGTVISFLVLIFSNSEAGRRNAGLLMHLILFVAASCSAFVIYITPINIPVDLGFLTLLLMLSAVVSNRKVIQHAISVVYSFLLIAAALFLNPEPLDFFASHTTVVSIFFALSILSVFIGHTVQKQSGTVLNTAAQIYSGKSLDLESEQIYNEIFHNSLEGLFRSTINGKFITANQALAKILGYDSEKEILSLNIPKQIYFDQEDRSRLVKILMAQKRVKNYRVRLKKKDGSELIARVNERLAVNEAEEPLFFEGSIQDITQQVKLEEERKQELNELKEEKKRSIKEVNTALYTSNIKAQFLASMSHEIKTPLNSIVGFLTLIERGTFVSQDELKEFAGNAKTAADSLLDIINNVLDISKLEAGKMQLDEIEFDIREEIEKAKSIIRPAAMDKKLNLSFDVAEDVPKALYGDPTRFRQICVNILSNAVKYTDSGEVALKCGLVKTTDATAKIFVKVIDTGRGIPPEKLPMLFKPYTQIGDKKWTRKEGTGLGLMITKEFVNLMGGEINVYSELGIGTTVELTAVLKWQKDFLAADAEEKISSQSQPVQEVELNSSSEQEIEHVIETEEIKPEEKTPPPPQTQRKSLKKRLLLVEDNPISQKVEKKLLGDIGYEVEVVANGFDAIEAAKTSTFDLILMDVEMPEMDGLTATHKIRTLEPPASKVPIIAVTAHSSMKDREKCLAAGMNDYIAKPININFMKMTIDQWLKRKIDD